MSLFKNVLVALFAALIVVGCYIRIPLPPVPITLQTFFVILVGAACGWKMGLYSVLIYLFLGAIGLPVFTGGGGLALLAGPTGGYLFGLIPAVIIAGMSVKKNSYVFTLLMLLLASISVYVPGLLQLGISRGFSVADTFKYGLYPFIIGDLLKLVVAASVAKVIRPMIEEKLNA